jgi:arylsulfatase A-like enzyme
MSRSAAPVGRAHRAAGVLVLLLACILAACAPALPAPAPTATLPAGARTGHVIVVSIDGLRPDAIDRAGARTLQRLRAEGASATDARTILPSKTLPSHTSMVTGVDVDVHGITWNTDLTARFGTVGVPTMFDVAHAAGLRTAAFVGKRMRRHLLRAGALDHTGYPRTESYLLADAVADEVVEYLRFARPALLFVHLPDPDIAGHAFGWMSPPYRVAVRRADAAVGYIDGAARRAFGSDYVLLVTADHGGSGHNHGSASDVDTHIPWIAWGRGVVAGPVTAPVRTYDTAATALWLLGVPFPPTWAGRPVSSAFSR